MILEVAQLNVREGQQDAFETAMRKALPLIAETPGFHGIEVRKCLERPNGYVLLVKWARVEDHTVGFRKSDRYEKWRALLHHFYDPFPIVEHYGETILSDAT